MSTRKLNSLSVYDAPQGETPVFIFLGQILSIKYSKTVPSNYTDTFFDYVVVHHSTDIGRNTEALNPRFNPWLILFVFCSCSVAGRLALEI